MRTLRRASLETLLTPRWRGFIKHLAKALDARGVDFAVIGGMALGKRAGRVRATSDIDILVPDERGAVRAAMKDAGFTPAGGMWPLESYTDGVLEVDVLCGSGDPEDSARELAEPVLLFGQRVKVATRVFLLWMYLLSDQTRHFDDGLNVIRAMQAAELTQLRDYLQHDGDRGSLRLLNRWVLEAAREEKKEE